MFDMKLNCIEDMISPLKAILPVICLAIVGCSTSGSVVKNDELRVGQSKIKAKDPFLMTLLDEDPFLCKCSEYFSDVNLEIIQNKNDTIFLVFENVTQPQWDYEDSKLGNGRLQGFYKTYDEAFAVVQAKRKVVEEERAKQQALAAERAQKERFLAEERAKQERIAAAKRAKRERILAEAKAAKERFLAEKRKQEEERQRLIMVAEQKKRQEERRQALLAMTPVYCEEMITAVNANEVRAYRQYPLQKTYRVVGVARDINVTYGEARVVMEENTDLWNTCTAVMRNFDDVIDMNVGDSFEFLCNTWEETAGSVIFQNCEYFSNVTKTL
jgi:hypothetical protein